MTILPMTISNAKEPQILDLSKVLNDKKVVLVCFWSLFMVSSCSC